jgi:hypothetical protein
MAVTDPDQAPAAPAYGVADFVQDLGTLLSDAERRANEWMEQRKAIQARLTDLRETADQLLRRLAADRGVSQDRVGGLSRTSTGRKGRERATRRMSAEARARIAAAQRARWAKRKRG